MTRHLTLLLALAACTGEPEEILPPPGCGDGVLDADEQCDDGEANADAPDACRTTCLTPRCGDALVDSGEDCDDGNDWGGDGCTPACAAEVGPAETEPNDTWDAATQDGGGVDGAITAGDRDCFSIEAAECETISAHLVGPCDAPAQLALHGPDGVLNATGSPGSDHCSAIDPVLSPGARFVAEGTWAVCVEGFLDGVVPHYRLEAEAGDSGGFDVDPRDDIDVDGLPDRCDSDMDGDGVLNLDDNCPTVPNGPDMAAPTPSADGFLRHWLVVGAFTGTSTTESCRPSDDELLGDDANAEPALGDVVDGLSWRVFISPEDRVGFRVYYGGAATPREVYAAVYVYSATARSTTFALGPDDGARAWLNGTEILDISGCQGTNIDQFTGAADLQAGWNRLVVKVRDQGGGWGMYARFRDGDGPITDLELSLDPGGSWAPGQSDLDGDGIGDVCDDTPAG